MQIRRTRTERDRRIMLDWEARQQKKHVWQNIVFSGFLMGIICLCVFLLKTAETPRSNAQINSSFEAAANMEQPSNAEEASLPGEDFQQLEDTLLVLVNGLVALPENYQVTPRLYGNILVDNRIYESLAQMIDDARAEDVVLWVASGYRSVEHQQGLLDQAAEKNIQEGYDAVTAMGIARQTIQLPGHSEHHTGLAVDFNTVSDSFEDTEEYRWLQAHAADYGFVQRYTADKVDITEINTESWHYRYVGKENAQRMQALGLCLEEYCMLLQGE